MTLWATCIGHLAIVVDSLDKAKWFFGEVFELSYEMLKEDQLLVQMKTSVLVAKLSPVLSSHECKQQRCTQLVLDHYGFQAPSKDFVDLFYKRVTFFGLEIVKHVYDRKDGRAFYFKDPFGNVVEYFWYDRGSL